jgi:hypothetical protein
MPLEVPKSNIPTVKKYTGQSDQHICKYWTSTFAWQHECLFGRGQVVCCCQKEVRHREET